MNLELPDLPYANDALEPVISARTLEFHHGKHHKGYVDKTKKAVADTALADASVEEIIHHAHASGDDGLFNNAAQTWNHAFYWLCLSPDGGGEPQGDLAAAIDDAFGSFEAFRKAFAQEAAGHFGSGWAWLVMDDTDGSLLVRSTHDADVPLVHGEVPLLTLDVWEHAYYLDYQNARPDYIEAALDKLVNWDFVARTWADARAAKADSFRLAA